MLSVINSHHNYLSKMTNFLKYAIVGLVATLVWEFGHPYIPGLVVDHDHEHVCEVKL